MGKSSRCPHAHARIKTFDSSKALDHARCEAIIQTPLTEFRFAGSPVAAVPPQLPNWRRTLRERSRRV